MLKLRQLDQVVTNFADFSDKDRADVQDIAYKDTKDYLDFKKKAAEEAAEQWNDTPQN